jgi:hypothetical protein
VDDITREAVKAIFSLAVSSITLGLGWIVGQRLTNYWSLRQKHHEINLSAAQDFHRLYGEFFALWKLWNYYIQDIGASNLPGRLDGNSSSEPPMLNSSSNGSSSSWQPNAICPRTIEITSVDSAKGIKACARLFATTNRLDGTLLPDIPHISREFPAVTHCGT